MRKAIAYAIGDRAGLAAAPRQRDHHRDLKPENLFITADDRVKILDLGLAKLTRDPIHSRSERARTAPPQTEAWPGARHRRSLHGARSEVRGLTRRSSRGPIRLWRDPSAELVSRPAARFRRDTAPETMTAILNEDPPDLPRPSDRFRPPSRASSIAAWRRVRRRDSRRPAISRSRPKRCRTFQAPRQAVHPRGEQAATNGSRGYRRSCSYRRLPLRRWRGRFGPTRRQFRRCASTSSPRRATDPASMALAPDGKQIVFAGKSQGRHQLLLRRLDSTSARPLPGTDDASMPFWSPDSRSDRLLCQQQAQADRCRRCGRCRN